MFRYFLKVLFYYLVFSFIFRTIFYLFRLSGRRPQPKSKPGGQAKAKQGFNHQNVIDAEFSEVK